MAPFSPYKSIPDAELECPQGSYCRIAILDYSEKQAQEFCTQQELGLLSAFYSYISNTIHFYPRKW